MPGERADADAEREPECTARISGDWALVHAPPADPAASSATWKNLFQWKAFTRKHRSEVLL